MATVVIMPRAARAQDATGEGVLSPEAQQIVSAVNAERSAAGLGSLAQDPLLNQAAQTHANDILHNYNYSHWGTDGTLARDRVVRTGYSTRPWVSENWVTSSSPESAMSWWMNDYIHRVNILMPRWTEVGVGVATRSETGEIVFVTVFSAGRDSVDATVSQSQPVVSASSAATSLSAPAGGAEYVVGQGDTLLAIALLYGYDFADIARANGLADDAILQIGQVLRIPGSAEEFSGSVGMGVGGSSSGATIPYVIQSGDTLVTIASKIGLSWQELARMNGLADSSILQIGQTIQIPDSDTVDSPTDASAESGNEPNELSDDDAVGESAILYVIKVGETLFGIALTYGADLQDLLGLNDLTEESIVQPGQLIRLR